MEVSEGKAHVSKEQLLKTCRENDVPRGFYKALQERIKSGQPAVIAEIKKASPSKGIIRPDFHPAEIAKSYYSAGASALSVLTDKLFFQGNDTFLQEVRENVPLPTIRKDFMVDEWQVIQSRAIGSDCVLLIAAALDDVLLKDLYDCACALDMDVLIEVHNAHEVECAMRLDPQLLGINNRNLNTFEVDLKTTIELKNLVAEDVLLVTESGICNAQDVALMHQHGINTFLVGEAFMRQENPGRALNDLFGTIET